MRWGRRGKREPPRNYHVWVVYDDGPSRRVQCEYGGLDKHGEPVWLARIPTPAWYTCSNVPPTVIVNRKQRPPGTVYPVYVPPSLELM